MFPSLSYHTNFMVFTHDVIIFVIINTIRTFMLLLQMVAIQSKIKNILNTAQIKIYF